MGQSTAASCRNLTQGMAGLRAQCRLISAPSPVAHLPTASSHNAPVLHSKPFQANQLAAVFFCGARPSSFLCDPSSYLRIAQDAFPFPTTQIKSSLRRKSSESFVVNKPSAIRAGQSAGTAGHFSPPPQYLQLAQQLAKKLAVAVVVAATIAGASIFSLPWVLSTPAGLRTATAVYSATIPGTVSVETAKLGWSEPVRIGGVKVSDAKGQGVLTVESIESEAGLWALVTGKSGLGNTTVQGLRVDLGRDETGGEPRALAALAKPQKMPAYKRAPVPTPMESPLPKSADEVPVDVDINVEMPGGSLNFPHSVFTLPWDTAAITGDSLQIDVAAGDFAARRDPEAGALASGGVLGSGNKRGGKGWVPVVAAARSDKFRASVAGAVDVRGGKLHLARPLEADIEVNHSTGELFLARLSPLLAGVVGTQDSSKLVRVYASPQDMVLPTEQYSLKVDPMTLVIGKGELVSSALEFLGQRGPGKTLTMRTSAIRATWHTAGRVEADRTDVRIGDKVHLITWGKIDQDQGTIDMVLAIPADTLKVALRVPSLASGYNLQFPLTGSVERPTLDWKAAGKQLAKLVVRQRAPNGWTGLLLTDRNDHRPLPESVDPISWMTKT